MSKLALANSPGSSMQGPGRNASHPSASQVVTESQRWASNQVWVVTLTTCGHPSCSLSLTHSLRGLFKNSLDPLEEQSEMSTGIIHSPQVAPITLSYLLT